MFLASLVLYELQVGAERTARQDAPKALWLSEWIDSLKQEFEVLALDADAAILTAKWMEGRPPELLGDAMIAACAHQRGLTVVTRNMRDFRHFPVSVLNPFEPQHGKA